MSAVDPGVFDSATPARRGGSHAVVVGGSIAGLLAARVLSDHFDAVTLLERDATTPGAEVRKGVPQGRHVHAFLARGFDSLEHLFPGFTSAIAADGATRIPMGRFYTHLYGTFRVQFETELASYCQSRPLLEDHVRRRVLALPNVDVRGGRDVTGLVVRDGVARGIRSRPREGGDEEVLTADFVADASGRGSRLPTWLTEVGCDRPEESSVKIDLGYATRVCARPPGEHGWEALIVVGHPPASKRHGVVFPIEGGRWLITLGGVLHDHPPTDPAGFEAFAASLPVPDVLRALQSAEPLSETVAHRFPGSVRRHYERTRGLPERLVVLGDALCSLNPMYGQGMTMCALEALELDTCLREQPDLTGVPGRYFRRVAKALDTAWMVTTSEEFRFPETEGARPLWLPFVHRYMDRVHALAAVDTGVADRILRVQHMLDHPTALFRPAVMSRVLRQTLRWST